MNCVQAQPFTFNLRRYIEALAIRGNEDDDDDNGWAVQVDHMKTRVQSAHSFSASFYNTTFKPQSREKNSQSFARARSRELAAEIAQSILTSCRILPQSFTNCYICQGVKPVTFLRGRAKSGKLSVLLAIRRSIGESPCWLTMSKSQLSVAPWK